MRYQENYGLVNQAISKISRRMQDYKPVGTPVVISTKLVKARDEDKCIGQEFYQSAIGSLSYLHVYICQHQTRAVSNLARFLPSPQNITGQH